MLCHTMHLMAFHMKELTAFRALEMIVIVSAIRTLLLKLVAGKSSVIYIVTMKQAFLTHSVKLSVYGRKSYTDALMPKIFVYLRNGRMSVSVLSEIAFDRLSLFGLVRHIKIPFAFFVLYSITYFTLCQSFRKEVDTVCHGVPYQDILEAL